MIVGNFTNNYTLSSYNTQQKVDIMHSIHIETSYAEIARSPSLRYASVGSLTPFRHNGFGNNSGSARRSLRSRLRITRNTRNCLSVFLRFAPKSLRQLCLFRSRYMKFCSKIFFHFLLSPFEFFFGKEKPPLANLDL